MKKGRTLLIVVLILAMVSTGAMRSFTVAQRRIMLKGGTGQSGPSLASMNSFALALLIGGLRGPLVMILWTQSEAQKTAKNLEGVETQIEWIRLLQPEFDTVHLFQIWNKAYNLSVQMASISNKYSMILDALAYAKSVDKERPDNINIMMAVANVLFDKLSNSSEKVQYKKRVREDTKYRPAHSSVMVAGVRPTRFDSLLNQDGTIRAKYLLPRVMIGTPANMANASAIANYYDGSELQFLKRYEPFPYGVNPMGLAYNAFKRSQILQDKGGQKHIQISAMVIDSRPALTLKAWAEDEWDVGTHAEARFEGIKDPPADRLDCLAVGTPVKPLVLGDADFNARKADWDQAVFQYSLALKLTVDSEAEFISHLANPEYQMHVSMYRSHQEHLAASRLLITGDLAYMQSMHADPAQRKKLLEQAAANYQQALHAFMIIRIRYFTNEAYYPTLLPRGMDRMGIDALGNPELLKILDGIDALNKKQGFDMNDDDTKEYNTYIRRAMIRMQLASQQ